MPRTIPSLCAAGLAGALLLTASPTYAAPGGGSHGDANAITATLLGETGDSGTAVASNDGTGEVTSGDANPPVSVLTGQPYAGLGVLAQDAIARDNGTSAACAGLAGDGGAVLQVGDSRCIEPGQNADVQLANLDLSVLLDSEVVEDTGSLGSILGGLQLPLVSADAIVAQLQAAVDDLESRLGNAGLVLDLGAIESSCTYDGESDGTTFLTNVGVSVAIPQVRPEPVPLLTLDPEPGPNTRVVTELDAVLALLLQELEAGLHANLDALTDPVFDVLLPQVKEDIVDAVLAQLQPALEEVEANVLELVLNRQERTGRSLDVTGLHAELLPGAAQFGAPTVLALDVANVGCGPFRSAVTPGTTDVTDTAGNPVPTVVNAGEDTSGWREGALLGLLGLVLATGAIVGVRRARA